MPITSDIYGTVTETAWISFAITSGFLPGVQVYWAKQDLK